MITHFIKTLPLHLVWVSFSLISSSNAQPSPNQDFAIKTLPLVLKEINELTRTYLDPAMRVRENRFIVKLNEGRIHYFKEDYRTSAMTLLELVETYDRKKNSPIYKDALFYLADSLYHIGNYRTSSRFFKLVLTLGEAKMRPCALGRLLEVALKLKNVEQGVSYYQEARRFAQDTSNNTLLYLLGKFSYERQKYTEAITMWKKVSKQSSMYPQARYFIGVAYMELQDLNRALNEFRKVKKLDLEVLKLGLNLKEDEATAPEVDVNTGSVIMAGVNSGDQQKVTTGCSFRSQLEKASEIKGWGLVKAHAELAVGRVLYELDKTNESYTNYLEIDRTSPLFMDAIRESVWVSIKRGEYQSALQQMDVQLIDEPNMLNDPFTRLLQGRLLSIIGRFADAQSIFGELRSRFETFKSRSLTPILARAKGQLATYFQRRLEKGHSALNLEALLPKAALQFTDKELSTSSSRSLFVELSALDQDIEFSKQTVKDLNWVLDAPNQSEIFPRLHHGLLKALELRYRLFAAQTALNNQRANLLLNEPEYQTLKNARIAAESPLAEVPQTQIQLDEREAKFERELMLLDLKLYRLEMVMKNTRAQLIAMKIYLQDESIDEVTGGIGPQKRASALKSVSNELKTYERHRIRIKALTEDIKKVYLRVGLFDSVYIQEEELRGQLATTLDQESEWLVKRGLLPVERLSEFERAHKIVDDFQERSMKLVSANTSSLREQVRLEEAKVKKYEIKLKRLNRQAKRLAGQMVAQIFYQVLKQLDQLILEADAGILDMLWAQKSQSSTVVQSERDRRRIHFEVLNRDLVE